MPADLFRFEEFELDLMAYELRRNGEGVRLERIPFELLTLLVERHGQMVEREEIIERIWGKDVFHDTEHGINTAVRKIRQALHDDPDAPRFVLTVPAKGYRFVASVEKVQSQFSTGPLVVEERIKPPVAEGQRRINRTKILISTVVFLMATVVAAFFRFHRVQALSEKDTIVIADFANSTGDTVFDDTLKQALSVELSQSPFLNILSDKKIAETLQMMGRQVDEGVNYKTAVEICQRTQSAAVLAGSIATLDSQYVIGLNAVSCRTGDILAKEQLRAGSKAEALKVVDRAAKKLRGRLGESLSTIQKFDTPLEQATTSSLEALKAYSLGTKALDSGDYINAKSMSQRAITLDPNFAAAHVLLAGAAENLGETDLSAENTKRAYELRDRASEREKLAIEAKYYWDVSGDLEKARQTWELMTQTYPRDSGAHFNLGNVYDNLGQYEKALSEARESSRLDPESPISYAYLAFSYFVLNRWDEARATAEEAKSRKPDSASLRLILYQLASLKDDAAGMREQLAWAAGKSGVEDVMLAIEADRAAYSGQLKKARGLFRQAVASAETAGVTETAAGYQARAALCEALFGNEVEARQRATAALELSTGRELQYAAALALALVGHPTGVQSQVQKVADGLATRFPEDTLVQFNYLPTLRAQLALSRDNPSIAIEALQAAAPFELGLPNSPFAPALYPAYVRGGAFLAAHRGAEATIEFQKILDHRGILWNAPNSALAHLQIGRAYAMQGDTTKARAAYQDFLTLWKDADSDIPILKQAKAEYAKLQ